MSKPSTKIINQNTAETGVITMLEGKFVYTKFHPLEQVDENQGFLDYASTSENIIHSQKRYVQINWSVDTFIDLNLKEKIDASIVASADASPFVHGLQQLKHIFLGTDFQEGYSYLTTSLDPGARVEISRKISEISNEQSQLEYLQSQMAQGVEINLVNGLPSEIPELDPMSGMPILKAEASKVVPEPDFLLISSKADNIIKGNIKSSFVQEKFADILPTAENIVARAMPTDELRYNCHIKYLLEGTQNNVPDGNYHIDNGGTTVGAGIPQLNFFWQSDDVRACIYSDQEPNSTALADQGWALAEFNVVGFLVIKSRIENGIPIFMYSRFVDTKIAAAQSEHHGPTYIDPNVAYGQTYRYEIRPVLGKTIFDPASTSGQGLIQGGPEDLILVVSDNSAHIDISCLELKPPQPPQNLRFSHLGDNELEVSWKKSPSFVTIDSIGDEWNFLNDTGDASVTTVDVNDIKGFQLFLRNSLHEPYQLVEYLIFNDTIPSDMRVESSESIPTSLKTYMEQVGISETIEPYGPIPILKEPSSTSVFIRPNVDYYFAMAAIDAHGNSSQLSAQYIVRRNNVTGELSVNFISSPGAPKQYPNLLIPGKLVQPSFSVSGYRYLDIYYCPDTTLTSMEISPEAVLHIQMFELETQIEKVIKLSQTSAP